MYIRSQDKTLFAECKRLKIWKTSSCKNDEYEILNQFQYTYDADDYDSLGIYKTKERCIEILDKIYQCILLEGLNIFEMPEE